MRLTHLKKQLNSKCLTRLLEAQILSLMCTRSSKEPESLVCCKVRSDVSVSDAASSYSHRESQDKK